MSPLHYIGDFLREWLLQIPLGIARALFVLTLTALLLWVLFLPRHQVTPPTGAGKPAENLKIWAALALAMQILVYAIW